MRSWIAAVIAVSVCSLQIHALAFHVHAMTARALDSDHHHGPAIHTHSNNDFTPHVDADELSGHGSVVTIAVPAATASASTVSHAEVTDVFSAPQLQLIGDARAIDVRSHGPPQSRGGFLRGPPISTQP